MRMSPKQNRSHTIGRRVLVIPAIVLFLAGCSTTTATTAAPAPEPAVTETTDHTSAHHHFEPDATTVVTLDLKFDQPQISIPVGTTLHWRNDEAITHTLTSGSWGEVNESTGLRGTQSADGLFDHTLSPMGADGDTFSFTFTEPGTYSYFCKPHLTMNATIIVTP